MKCPKCGSEMVRLGVTGRLLPWYCPNPQCGHEEKVGDEKR